MGYVGMYGIPVAIVTLSLTTLTTAVEAWSTPPFPSSLSFDCRNRRERGRVRISGRGTTTPTPPSQPPLDGDTLLINNEHQSNKVPSEGNQNRPHHLHRPIPRILQDSEALTTARWIIQRLVATPGAGHAVQKESSSFSATQIPSFPYCCLIDHGDEDHTEQRDDSRLPKSGNTSTALDTTSEYDYLFDLLYESALAKDDYTIKFNYHQQQQQHQLSRRDNIEPQEHLPLLRRRYHYAIHVAYDGSQYCGWQRQPLNLEQRPSVQHTLETWIQEYLQTTEGVNLRACGRTDAGVHAIQQVCRFRTRQPLNETKLHHYFQTQSTASTSSTAIRVLAVQRVSLRFHPVESCRARAYAYVLDLSQSYPEQQQRERFVHKLDAMLQQLEGQELNYFAMSYGRLTTNRRGAKCTLFHARAKLMATVSPKRTITTVTTGMTASENSVSDHDIGDSQYCCIEFVGNRFLRRMVRLLVSNALGLLEGKGDSDSDSMALRDLIENSQSQSRRYITWSPAHSGGLIFVGATFQEETKKSEQG